MGQYCGCSHTHRSLYVTNIHYLKMMLLISICIFFRVARDQCVTPTSSHTHVSGPLFAVLTSLTGDAVTLSLLKGFAGKNHPIPEAPLWGGSASSVALSTPSSRYSSSDFSSYLWLASSQPERYLLSVHLGLWRDSFKRLFYEISVRSTSMYGYKRRMTVKSQSSKINSTVLSCYSIGDRKESLCHPINNIYWENSLYTVWNLICFYSPYLQTLMILLYYFPLLCDASWKFKRIRRYRKVYNMGWVSHGHLGNWVATSC